MIEAFRKQLLSRYSGYLSDLVSERPFTPIILRGEKTKPSTTAELHAAIVMFQQNEKKIDKKGWRIEWHDWKSKKLGNQKWPNRIFVETADDFIYLLKKESEVGEFKTVLADLLQWQPATLALFAKKPDYIFEYTGKWQDIKNVVDVLLQKDVGGYYIRSIPVPVHTKFLEDRTHRKIIIAILKAVAPDRYQEDKYTLEQLLGLKKASYIYPLRWLDKSLSEKYMHGMELTGVTADWLRIADWDIKEIWLVENGTNLHMLPSRAGAIAIFSRGKATHSLKNIALFSKVQLYYWGDLDDEGYAMLDAMHGYYPNLVSVFMDEATLLSHSHEMGKQKHKYRNYALTRLRPKEQAAYNILKYHTGRLEQEKIRQDYMADFFESLK